MADADGASERSKRPRRAIQHPGDAASSTGRNVGDVSDDAATRPTPAERESALAMIAALKAAPLDPPLLASSVAADRCVNMVAAAMSLRCGETFANMTAAMRTFGKSSSKPSELQSWMDKLALLAAHERVGAILTTIEQGIVDALERARQSAEVERAIMAAREEEEARAKAERERAAAATRPDFLGYYERMELWGALDEALKELHMQVDPRISDVKALAEHLAEQNAASKHHWDRPGVGDDWETTWRKSAKRDLIQTALRGVPEYEPFTERAMHHTLCGVCSQKTLCDHKLTALCDAWTRMKAERDARARIAQLRSQESLPTARWTGPWAEDTPALRFDPRSDPFQWYDRLRELGLSSGTLASVYAEDKIVRMTGRDRRHSV